MHQDNSRTGFRSEPGHRIIEAESTDVVNDLSSRLDSPASDAGAVGINGNRYSYAAREGFDHRQHSSHLFVLRNLFASRTAGLAADINNVGAFLLDFLAPGYSLLGVEVPAAIGKRIGRDVEDAHDDGAFPQ